MAATKDYAMDDIDMAEKTFDQIQNVQEVDNVAEIT